MHHWLHRRRGVVFVLYGVLAASKSVPGTCRVQHLVRLRHAELAVFVSVHVGLALVPRPQYMYRRRLGVAWHHVWGSRVASGIGC